MLQLLLLLMGWCCCCCNKGQPARAVAAASCQLPVDVTHCWPSWAGQAESFWKLRLRVVINRTHDKDASGCGNRTESATLAESWTAASGTCHRLATTWTGWTCSGHLWHTRTGYVRLGKLAMESGDSSRGYGGEILVLGLLQMPIER